MKNRFFLLFFLGVVILAGCSSLKSQVVNNPRCTALQAQYVSIEASIREYIINIANERARIEVLKQNPLLNWAQISVSESQVLAGYESNLGLASNERDDLLTLMTQEACSPPSNITSPAERPDLQSPSSMPPPDSGSTPPGQPVAP